MVDVDLVGYVVLELLLTFHWLITARLFASDPFLDQLAAAAPLNRNEVSGETSGSTLENRFNSLLSLSLMWPCTSLLAQAGLERAWQIEVAPH